MLLDTGMMNHKSTLLLMEVMCYQVMKWVGHLKCSTNVSDKRTMDSFDDIQIEDFSSFDLVEEMNEGLFEEENDDKSFNAFLNSNCDFWFTLY